MPHHGSCLAAICSHSLGRHYAGHGLEAKLAAAAAHGFTGMELMFEDLNAVALRLPGGATPSNLVAAAKRIRSMAESVSVRIVDLQPFSPYEGLRSRPEHEEARGRAKLWFRLANALGTDLVLVSSSTLPESECTSDMAAIVRDMAELAELAALERPPIRLAYEGLAWGTHIDTWEGVHAVVSAVGRSNFGYCFDTFNIAGRVYADPASQDGMAKGGDEALAQSLRRMVAMVEREKVFLVQVEDAERVSHPISSEHPWLEGSKPTRLSWSRNARAFAFEEERGAYLPILDICRALFEGLGFRGWVSLELFSRTLEETSADVPEEHAARAERSWRRLVEAFPQIVGENQ